MKNPLEANERLVPAIKKAEKNRKHQLIQLYSIRALFLIPLLLLVAVVLSIVREDYSAILQLGALTIATTFCLYYFGIRGFGKSYKWTFKKEVFSKLVELYFPTVSYMPQSDPQHTAILSKSGLLDSFNSCEIEDYFKGKTTNQHDYHFMQLTTSTKYTYKGRKQNPYEQHTTLYSGLFFELETSLYLQEDAVFFAPNPDQIELGPFQEWIKKVRFRNEVIKKIDAIDEIQRQALPNYSAVFRRLDTACLLANSGLLEILQRFNEVWDCHLSCSWVGNKIYISLPTTFDFFEPNIHQSFHDTLFINRLQEQINHCLTLLEELSQLSFDQVLVPFVANRPRGDDYYDHLIDY